MTRKMSTEGLLPTMASCKSLSKLECIWIRTLDLRLRLDLLRTSMEADDAILRGMAVVMRARRRRTMTN
ncbi:unnamed protein product [Prunus armeniaca]